MGYNSFLCSFIWRFMMAFLAHVNWFTAAYIKCIYFTYWKSWDLFWFWMHLFLCICFESLRPENYLLVWLNLIRKKCTTSSNKSFRQIYNDSYNRKFTKSERELKKIELQEMDDSDSENDENTTLNTTTKPNSSSLYPRLIEEEQDMPTLSVSRKPNDKNTKVNFRQNVESENFINYQAGHDSDARPTKSILSKVHLPKVLKDRFSSIDSNEAPKTPESDAEGGKWTGKFPKLLPSALRRSNLEDDELSQDKAESKAIAAEEKRLKKEQTRRKKQQLKEIRERRKEHLRRQNEIEKRRKRIADAIELLLQCLRLFTTFAILVGNIHKTFMPDYLKAPENNLHNPEILMIFSVTLGLEILLFWTLFISTMCKQCRLCCRMGCCKFLLWFGALLVGLYVEYFPFHLANDQLDMTWCKFEYGTDLYNFFSPENSPSRL